MKVQETTLAGVFIVEPKAFFDERGFFMEVWHAEKYEKLGLPSRFVQDNLSVSRKGVLRGLHFQHPAAQGKLVSALQGEIFDVAVDIRRSSPTFGKWFGTVLSGENKRQIYVPEGFAHGFCTLSESATVLYKCTDFYNPKTEATLRWDDPALGVVWPVRNPIVSEKDQQGVLLADFSESRLPS